MAAESAPSGSNVAGSWSSTALDSTASESSRLATAITPTPTINTTAAAAAQIQDRRWARRDSIATTGAGSVAIVSEMPVQTLAGGAVRARSSTSSSRSRASTSLTSGSPLPSPILSMSSLTTELPHVIAQRQQPAPDVALDRAQWDAGAFGDLLVREPVDVRQPDHLARSCGERIEGVGDRHPVGHTVDLGFGVRAGGRRRRFLGDVGPAVGVTALASHVIDDPMLGDADQPRSQRAAGRVELITPTPGADEHVLGDLAGGVVAERLATDRVDERAVGVIDRPQIGVAARERCAEGIGVITQLCLGHTPMVSVASGGVPPG